MNPQPTLTLDGKTVPINGERNLLELIRKTGIDLPTFCYHSELSVYGACRLCIVDIEGRGVVTSCSTTPEPGMVVRTSTGELREMRQLTIELLLADHEQNCPTCPKSGACRLQDLARRLGVNKVRFKPTRSPLPVDESSPSLVRDPNKCILCGDCVRVCAEIQGIGAIDFVRRGSQAAVEPAFGKDLARVECVSCGQCARVCPTGALTIRSEVDAVWKDVHDANKTVVAQIAPAVRVALGEAFGLAPGKITTGQIAAALRALGFNYVYDTSFTADLTVIEEANEFLKRFEKGERLPQFTSCCPAWVTYAEQFCNEMLPLLSTCRSPQQMFGAVAKATLPERLNIPAEQLVVVSIMPCTAKKAESQQSKFAPEAADVDHVLTTQELAAMIREAGIDFNTLQPESLDMPLGFKTGAGIIFGNSGGVTEAVLRYASEVATGTKLDSFEFTEVRGEAGLREATIELNGKALRLAMVHGLANAKRVIDQVRAGTCPYDFVEVMSCPGGCVGGAGQPCATDHPKALRARTQGLYKADKMLDVHKPQENFFVTSLYTDHLGDVGGKKAHELLHTHYSKRRRIEQDTLNLLSGKGANKLAVTVCLGTNCHTRGAGKILSALIQHVREHGLRNDVDVNASFCYERCDRGPVVRVGSRIIEKCTFEKALEALEQELAALKATTA